MLLGRCDSYRRCVELRRRDLTHDRTPVVSIRVLAPIRCRHAVHPLVREGLAEGWSSVPVRWLGGPRRRFSLDFGTSPSYTQRMSSSAVRGGTPRFASALLAVVLWYVIPAIFLFLIVRFQPTAECQGSGCSPDSGAGLFLALYIMPVMVVGGSISLIALAVLLLTTRLRAATVGTIAALAGMAILGVAVVGRFQSEAREQRESEFQARLDSLDTDLIYHVSVDEYAYLSPAVGYQFHLTPIDQEIVEVWQDHDIAVTVSRTPVAMPGCGPDPIFGPDPWPRPVGDPPADEIAEPVPTRCTPAGRDLWYRTGEDRHEYLRREGEVVIRAGAGSRVEASFLREAVEEARLATADERVDLLRALP